MTQPNAIGWFDIYVDDLPRATAFYEAVLLKPLTPLGDPTGDTQMMSFSPDMAAYGAGGALVKSRHARPGAGGKVLQPKFSIGEFGWVSLCEDTEGNRFGLSSRA